MALGHVLGGLRRRTAAGAIALTLLAAGGLTLGWSAGTAGAAASTVGAQLTLSGVATASSPTGGNTVGVHPGDSVSFTAAAAPTAGLPTALKGLLDGLLNGLAGVDVVIQSGNLPGVAYPYRLGPDQCPGTHPSVTVPFAQAGTYTFTYSLSSVTVLPILGCSFNQVQLTGAQLAALTQNQIAINAGNVYTGQVVAAADPPSGGISIQLPSVSVAPKVGPIQGPTVSVPGVTTPTLPVHLPGGASAGSGAGSGASSGGSNTTTDKYTPPGLTVPQLVMPNAGSGGSGGGFAGVAADAGANALGVASDGSVPAGSAHPTPSSGAATSLAAQTTRTDAATTSPSSPQTPVVLAVGAIVALSLVAAAYARLKLLHR